MKTLLNFPVCLLGTIVLVSCSTDSASIPTILMQPPVAQPPVLTGGNLGEVIADVAFNPYFGFLDGAGSSSTFIDIPAESTPSNLLIGRWKITGMGIDENNDGNIKYYNYEDLNHKDCGNSFFQFNTDGIVFENSYFDREGTCTLNSEMDAWELIEGKRFKIYAYDNIYLVNFNPVRIDFEI